MTQSLPALSGVQSRKGPCSRSRLVIWPSRCKTYGSKTNGSKTNEDPEETVPTRGRLIIGSKWIWAVQEVDSSGYCGVPPTSFFRSRHLFPCCWIDQLLRAHSCILHWDKPSTRENDSPRLWPMMDWNDEGKQSLAFFSQYRTTLKPIPLQSSMHNWLKTSVAISSQVSFLFAQFCLTHFLRDVALWIHSNRSSACNCLPQSLLIRNAIKDNSNYHLYNHDYIIAIFHFA